METTSAIKCLSRGKLDDLSYSLGDAIDWKRFARALELSYRHGISYSLGDAIDWKHYDQQLQCQSLGISYSLGDAIDWKLFVVNDAIHSYGSPTR